ncbi:MAG: site-specific integrase [Bradyrhizobium sp.]|jgi:integrase|nr:site-specific integrase [Bradyrhizobium sp.]
MSLGKQAKTLSKGQIEPIFGYLSKTRYPIRNRVIFLLSLKAGLRAKEIASLTWEIFAKNSNMGVFASRLMRRWTPPVCGS